MAGQNGHIEELAHELISRGFSRRDVIKRGIALGLTAPAIQAILANGAFAQDAPVSPAAAGPVNVPIVGKDMTFDEIKAAIEAEGEVTVGNWTYTANDQLIEQFQKYVKTVYDVDVTLNYQASQSPSTYLTDLYTAVGAGDSSPYDVLAIEENYWAEVQIEATKQGTKLMEDFLPSGLIPNAERVMDPFKHVPTTVGFQSSATPGINYDKTKLDWLTDWKDLGDERLKGKLLMWLPGDITGGGILLGVCKSLGLDYKNPEHIDQTIAFLVDKVHPNAVKYTADFGEAQALFSSGTVDAVTFWDSLARLNYLDGQTGAAFLVAASGQYAVNGFMWIPVKPKHPVLAQIFIDWRLSDDGQFPDIDAWGITKGAWSELHEGFMGPSYEALVPEWLAADYFSYYPTIEQLSTQYLAVDWDYYAANSKAWFDAWLQGIGL
jgi:spermidine/putrescine-binding protein